MTPNYVLANEKTHIAKGVRALQHWPEIEIVPWDEDASQSEVERQAS